MKPVSTRLTDEDIKRIEEEQQGGEKQSATVRRLIRKGLDDDSGGSLTPSTLLLMFGAIIFGVAMEPVASSAFLIAISGTFFLLAVAAERGVFR